MKSISKRLTLRIMMVVLAMMSVIAGVVYVAVGEYMDDEAEKRFQIVVTRAHREVQRRRYSADCRKSMWPTSITCMR